MDDVERASRAERVETLRRTVGFDAYAWVLIDPVTAVGSSPLADVPCLPELPRLIRLKYLTRQPVDRSGSCRCDPALGHPRRPGPEPGLAGAPVVL